MKVKKQSIQRLIQSVSLLEHMRLYLDIKRSTGGSLARCPFHNDSHPSLYIYPEHYHCFSCKAHGNILDFEMHRTGLSFKDAVITLAQKYQIHLDFEETSVQEQEEEKQSRLKSEVLKEILTAMSQKHDLTVEHSRYCFAENDDVIFRSLLQNHRDVSLLEKYGLYDFSTFKITKKISRNDFRFESHIILPLYGESSLISSLLLYPKNVLETTEPLRQCKGLKIGEDHQSALHALFGWSDARSSAGQNKSLYVFQNLTLFTYYINQGLSQSVVSLAQFTFGELKILGKRVQKLYMVFPERQVDYDHLLELFKVACLNEEIEFYVALVPENTISPFSPEEPNSHFATIRTLLDFISEHLYALGSESERKSLFYQNVVLPLQKVSDALRREALIDDLAQKWFGSSKHIFQNTPPTQFNNTRLLQRNSIKAPKLELEKNTFTQSDIYSLLERVKNFYHLTLMSSVGQAAQDYLLKRGISKNAMEKWKLGFCPDENLLCRKLGGKSFEISLLEYLGVIKRRQRVFGASKTDILSTHYEFFHGRILIPISNSLGQAVGFGGRIFKDVVSQATYSPKYLNSAESQTFSKSSILFHYFEALPAIMRENAVIVVEGYMDCISLVEAGIENVVAVLGVALTTQHLELLSKVTQKVYLCFDSDKAGQQAARRSLASVLAQSSLEVYSFTLSDAKDPDDYVKMVGKEGFLSYMSEKAIPLFEQVCLWESEDAPNYEVLLKKLRANVLPLLQQPMELSKRERNLFWVHQSFFNNLPWEEFLTFFTNQPKRSYAVSEEKLNGVSVSCENLENLILERQPWPVRFPVEVKFLFVFAMASVEQIPERVKNNFFQKESATPANEKICASALSHILSPSTQHVFQELLKSKIEQPFMDFEYVGAAMKESGLLNFSVNTQLVFAYLFDEIKTLAAFGLEGLLKSSLISNVTMVDFYDFLSIKNAGFLQFHKRNTKISYQNQAISQLLGEVLLEIELLHIDTCMKELSRHKNDESSIRLFTRFANERTRRLSELKTGIEGTHFPNA